MEITDHNKWFANLSLKADDIYKNRSLILDRDR